MTFNKSLTAIAILLFSSISIAQVTYTYEGPTFMADSIFGSYTTSNRVTLSFELANAVPAGSAMADRSADVLSWTFSDGNQVLNEGNSYLPYFQFSTNLQGQPDEWLVSAYSNLNTRGTFISVVEASFDRNNLQQDFGSQNFLCDSFGGPGGLCDGGADTSTNSGSYFVFAPPSSNGNWSGGQPQIIPSLNQWAMILMGLILLGFAGFRMRKMN